MQYPDLNCARVARSFLVGSFSESLVGCGRPSNTIFFFLIFDSLVDCVRVNCLECWFPIIR